MNTNRREDVQKILLALLVSHQDAMDIVALNKEYVEQEGEQVPWRAFGHVSLLDFLQSMPKLVHIERRNNRYYVRGVPTGKIKHVSSLVARQRAPSKKFTGIRRYKPSHFFPKTERPKIRLSAETLASVVELVKKHPKGISKDYLLLTVNRQYPHVVIALQDFEDQLRELSHEVAMEDNLVYPVKTSEWKSEAVVEASPIEWPMDLQSRSGPSPKYYESVTNHQRRLSRNTESYSVHQEQMAIVRSSSHCNEEDQSAKDDVNYLDNANTQTLINDRIKFRLEKLIQNHTNGIWCAELPQLYLQEYKVELKYTELGFNSVREFASHLQDIFHCVQPYSTGDCLLYNAKKVVPDNSEKRNLTLAELYSMQAQDDIEPMPAIVSTDTSKKLIPEGVMTTGETVGQLSVENLMYNVKPFVEVLVVEVFTPSFFWIHLRKKKKFFETFMKELDDFYKIHYEDYTIPPVVLEKGLNCACIYADVWHRGIIKSVAPDLQVTVFFYDYGTLKTYPANEIYYLDRKFSSLPAQAIPCGLINTRPLNSDQWPKEVTHQFAMETCQVPLVATIGSIDINNNSMMITLTNTLGEEDMHINDWLVEQNLAVHGAMVRMRCRHFSFRYYVKCRELLKKCRQISNDYANCVKNANKLCAESIRENIALCDSRTILKTGQNPNEDRFHRVDVHHSLESGIKTKLSESSIKVFESKGTFNKIDYNPKMERTPQNDCAPTAAKELIRLYEKLKSLSSTQNSGESFSTTGRDNLSTRQNISIISKTDLVPRNHDTTVCSNSSSSKSLLNCIIEKSKERKKLKHFNKVEQPPCDIKDQPKESRFSLDNEKVRKGEVANRMLQDPSENTLLEYSPMKPSEYCFSPTDSVCDDNDADTRCRQFKSKHGKLGQMESIDWSDVCDNGSSEIRIKSAPKQLIPKELPSDVPEACNIPHSVNSPVLASPHFLNIVRHSLYSENEVVCRPPEGNIDEYQTASKFVLMRKKNYMQDSNRVIGVPQKILSLLRGTSLSEDDPMSQETVDVCQLPEHEDLDKKEALVEQNEPIIRDMQLKHDINDVVKYVSKSNHDLPRHTSFHEDELNVRISGDSSTSSEVMPESSSSINSILKSVTLSSDISSNEISKAESPVHVNQENPQTREDLLALQPSYKEEFIELEALPKETSECNEKSQDNSVILDYNRSNLGVTSQKSRILEIMKLCSNLQDTEYDSDDLSSAEASENFGLSIVNPFAKSELVRKDEQKSDVPKKLEEKVIEVKFSSQLTEPKAEQEHKEELHNVEALYDTESFYKIDTDDVEYGETGEVYDEHYDEVTRVQQAADISKSAPVFNDVDINSEDDDEWDAFIDTCNLSAASGLCLNEIGSYEEESDSGLKIEERNDTDGNVSENDNYLPVVPEVQTIKNQNDVHNFRLDMSNRKRDSVATEHLTIEQTEPPEVRSLTAFKNIIVDDSSHWQPRGKRKTLMNLLQKVESAII